LNLTRWEPGQGKEEEKSKKVDYYRKKLLRVKHTTYLMEYSYGIPA
jgi:hypothetical protein